MGSSSTRHKNLPSASCLLGIQKSNEHGSKVVPGCWRNNTRKTRVTDMHTRVYNNMVPWDLRALGTKRVEIQKIWYQKVVEGQISTVKWKCRHLEREPFITSKGKLLESTFFSCCLLCGARWFVSVLRPRVWSFKWKPLRLKYFVAVSLYAVALYIVALCLNSVVEILKCQRSFKWKPLCNYFSYDTLQYALRIEMNSTEHYFPVLLNFTF